MSSCSNDSATNDKISFLCLAEQHCIMCVCYLCQLSWWWTLWNSPYLGCCEHCHTKRGFVSHWYFFFWEFSVQILCPFLNWIGFCCCCVSESLINCSSFVSYMAFKCFSHSLFTLLIASFAVQKPCPSMQAQVPVFVPLLSMYWKSYRMITKTIVKKYFLEFFSKLFKSYISVLIFKF